MTYLLSIDPGKATGIALGTFNEHQYYVREKFWLVKNGVDGFMEWYWRDAPIEALMARWVSEAFVLSGGNDFVANLDSVKIEGAMTALGLHPIYQLRSNKALVKDQVLKDGGLWVTGSMCGHTDGRDVNDATIHALGYLKKLRHRPTLVHYWGGPDTSHIEPETH